MVLTLKQLQKRMVPARSKEGSDIDDQWLPPASYDKKLKGDDSDVETYDKSAPENQADNFKAQDSVKKNTRAPLKENAGNNETQALVSQRTNEIYEEESLELLEEITDLIELDQIDSYAWSGVASRLRDVRDHLANSIISESIEQLDESFKAGKLKLKDKTTVTISRADAKALNQAVSGTDNKSKMLNSAMKSKKDFIEFLEFSKNLEEDFIGAINDLLFEATEDQLQFISDNELNEMDSWNLIKNSTKTGATIMGGAGYATGALMGASMGAGIVAARRGTEITQRAIEKYRANRRDKKETLDDSVVRTGRHRRRRKRFIGEDESILGTSAPALDSDKKKKRDKEEDNLQENRRTFSGHKFKDSIGGDSSNYRNPPVDRIKFRNPEPAKKLDSYVITNNSNNIRGALAKEVGDIVDVKVDTNRFTKMKVTEKVGNRLAVVSLKEDVEQLDEISKKTTQKYLNKAISDHTMSNFARTSTTGKENEYWTRRVKNRKRGISRAIDNLDKKDNLSDVQFNIDAKKYKTASRSEKIALEKKWGARSSYFKEDVEQLDEISKKTLLNYVDGAILDQMSAAISGHSGSKVNQKSFTTQSDIRKFIEKRGRGIDRAERALERKDSISALYKRLGVKNNK